MKADKGVHVLPVASCLIINESTIKKLSAKLMNELDQTETN